MKLHLNPELLTQNLQELFGEEPKLLHRLFKQNDGPDVVADVAGRNLNLYVRVAVNPAALIRHADQIGRGREDSAGVDVLVVPLMTDGPANLCRELEINWLDLAGNCDVRAPGLRLYVRGRKPVEPEPRRQPGLSSPKSLEFLRAVALPKGPVTQREAARLAGVDEAQASRITQKLIAEKAVERQGDGTLHVTDMDRMVEMLAAGKPGQHESAPLRVRVDHGGTGAAWQALAGRCTDLGLQYALGGEAAASILLGTRAAAPARLWISGPYNDDVAAKLGAHVDPHGDVALHMTDDPTRLLGRWLRDGVWIAAPIQVYLDCRSEAVSPSLLEALSQVVRERHELE